MMRLIQNAIFAHAAMRRDGGCLLSRRQIEPRQIYPRQIDPRLSLLLMRPWAI